MSKLFLFALIVHHYTTVSAFDWLFYSQAINTNFDGIFSAMRHYGLQKNNSSLKGSAWKLHNTNFDAEYYIKHNNLMGINTSNNAIDHYITIGKYKQYKYCQSYRICIFLHLYDISMLSTLIKKINFFMHNNPTNTYAINIAIPVDDRLNQEIKCIKNIYIDDIEILKFTEKYAPYHPQVITESNIEKIIYLIDYIYANVTIPKERISILFTENRGVDIGTFFLQIDQAIKKEERFDFLVKIHTKQDPLWFSFLTSFFNIKINLLLKKFQAIYSCILQYPDIYMCQHQEYMEKAIELTKEKNIPNTFNFAAGTMFIVSYDFIEKIKNWDLIKMYNECKPGKPRMDIVHAFERIFGAIIDMLALKTFILDYYPLPPETIFGEKDADL